MSVEQLSDAQTAIRPQCWRLSNPQRITVQGIGVVPSVALEVVAEKKPSSKHRAYRMGWRGAGWDILIDT